MTRSPGLVLSVLILCSSAALAQQKKPVAVDPATTDSPDAAAQANAPQGGLHEKEALTEEELRQQRIRAIDVRDKTDQQTQPAEQTQPADPDSATKPTRPVAATPLPGSVAAGNRKPAQASKKGPDVLEDSVSAPTEQYVGPAVLSRSYTINRPDISQNLKWTPFLSISGLYNTGLTGGAVSPDGTLSDISARGIRAGWGINGMHLWRHDQVRLDYRGELNRYANVSGYNGTNHSLSLDYQHAFSRRLLFDISEIASSYTQSYTLSNPALGIENSVANMNLAASPTVQILDNGVRQASTSVALVWRKSARLSFNLGGGYFGVVRNGAGLIGNTGYTSTADVNYRYTRKVTVGAYYAFSDFTFSHHIQMANSHTVGLIYSYAFSRTLEARMRFGGTRLESQGLASVAIDPVIAALLGQSSAIVSNYSLHYVSDISAEISKDFGRSHTARLSYARGVSPGNGLQLTSVQQSLAAGFSMPVFRRNRFDAGGGQDSLTSAGQSIGSYASRYVSAGFSHRFEKGFSEDFRIFYRTFDITTENLNHGQFSISLGFSWRPDENPFHF